MKNETSVMAILAAALGGPVPGFLRKLLTRLKVAVETKAGEGDQNADQ